MLRSTYIATQDMSLQQKRDRVSEAKAQKELSAKRVKEAREQMV